MKDKHYIAMIFYIAIFQVTMMSKIFRTFFLSVNLQMVFVVELLRGLAKADVPSIAGFSSTFSLGYLCIFLTSPYNCKLQRK